MFKLNPITAALSAAFIVAGCGGSDDSSTGAINNATTNAKSTLAVFGDSPYGNGGPTDTAQFLASPAFIKSINDDTDVAAVLNVGDIHSGKEYCTEAYNLSIYKLWTSFKSPLVYTPGDNEWTDCHKKKQGGGEYNATTGMVNYLVDASGNLIDHAGGDPVANLALVRSIFFAAPGKTIGGAMAVHSQARDFDINHPSDSSYVENVWFEQSKVLVVTLNIPGGSNNDTDPWYGTPNMSSAQAQEVANRSAANLRWLDAAFKQASTSGDIAVVIQVQADMWDIDGAAAGAAHLSNYKPFIDSMARNAQSFGKPVLLLNGDSHVYRSDNPLVQGAPCVIEPSPGAAAVACSSTNMPAASSNPADPYLNQPFGYNVPNFHRVVVHGSTTPLEWIKLVVDPSANAVNGASAFGPFSWQRMQPR